MASLEDYDEFGNYIGADLDSDDEEEVEQDQFAQPSASTAPLEGYDDEPMQGQDNGMDLMEVDGTFDYILSTMPQTIFIRYSWQRSQQAAPLFSMKTSNIIRVQGTYMEQTSRLWYRRKMPNRSLNPLSRLLKYGNGQ